MAAGVGAGEVKDGVHPREICDTVACPKCGCPESRIIRSSGGWSGTLIRDGQKVGEIGRGQSLQCTLCGHQFNA